MTERSRSETNAASPSKTNAADGTTLDVDAAFDLLSNARRRGVLYALKRDAVGRDGAATVEELAEWVATWQGDDDSSLGDESPSPEQVRTSLVHAHLPRLDDANVVDYDRDAGTAELADADDLDPLLRATGEPKPTSSSDSHSGLAD